MSLQEPDQISKNQTIYEVGAGEIIWRNFLAGMSRAAGGLVIYLAVMLILGNVFLTYVWPVIEPAFVTLEETTDLLQQLNMLQQPRFGR